MKSAAIALAFVAVVASAHGADVLPFVKNDYSRAIQQARAAKLPLFVDVWAPW